MQMIGGHAPSERDAAQLDVDVHLGRGGARVVGAELDDLEEALGVGPALGAEARPSLPQLVRPLALPRRVGPAALRDFKSVLWNRQIPIRISGREAQDGETYREITELSRNTMS